MTAPLPSMDSLTRPGTSLPLGTSLVMFRTQRVTKQAAWKLIEYPDVRRAFHRVL
jgi:hypothetical protein